MGLWVWVRRGIGVRLQFGGLGSCRDAAHDKVSDLERAIAAVDELEGMLG